MPDETKLPVQFHLDRDRLKRIENTLEETSADVKTILAYDGPLGTMIGELKAQDAKIEGINEKLDDHDQHIEKIKGTQLSLATKIAGLGLCGGTIGYVLIEVLKQFSG